VTTQDQIALGVHGYPPAGVTVIIQNLHGCDGRRPEKAINQVETFSRRHVFPKLSLH
jgi:hypothetical protein